MFVFLCLCYCHKTRQRRFGAQYGKMEVVLIFSIFVQNTIKLYVDRKCTRLVWH